MIRELNLAQYQNYSCCFFCFVLFDAIFWPCLVSAYVNLNLVMLVHVHCTMFIDFGVVCRVITSSPSEFNYVSHVVAVIPMREFGLPEGFDFCTHTQKEEQNQSKRFALSYDYLCTMLWTISNTKEPQTIGSETRTKCMHIICCVRVRASNQLIYNWQNVHHFLTFFGIIANLDTSMGFVLSQSRKNRNEPRLATKTYQLISNELCIRHIDGVKLSHHSTTIFECR